MDLYFVLAFAVLFSATSAQSTVTVTSCTGNGMVVDIAVDTSAHPAGIDNYYLAGCNTGEYSKSDDDDTTPETFQVTIPMTTIEGGSCGVYTPDPADGSAAYNVTVVIPRFSILVTKNDLKVEVVCNFLTTYVATLKPNVAIVTQPPDITDAGNTKLPILDSEIVGTDMLPLAEIIVGDPVVLHVFFVDNQEGYWDAMLAEELFASDSPDVYSGIKMVENSCPNATYAPVLRISYSTPVKVDNVKITYDAFRFSANTGFGTILFLVKVRVCASTAADDLCTTTCPDYLTRRKRELINFMDEVLHQSHFNKREIDAEMPPVGETAVIETETNGKKRPVVVEKTLRLTMRVRDPMLDTKDKGTGLLPGVVDIGKKREICIPRGTGVAVLVSLLVLVVFAATMSLLCFYLTKRRGKKSSSSAFLSKIYASSIPSTKSTNSESNWTQEQCMYDTTHRSPLVEHDHLSVMQSSLPVTIYANDLSDPTPPTVSPTTLARAAAKKAKSSAQTLQAVQEDERRQTNC